MQTIPIGLERKDLIGIAPTGSGKSAAFLIPMINYLMTLPPQDDILCKDGPYALILAPSRELAIQIEEEFQRLAIGTHLRSFVVVGGRREEEQAFHLKRGIEVLIGTPGRIKESLLKKFLVLDQCSWAVLDEADKMIDLGFEADVNFILDSITT
jgi:ATP-dependent RNA helicase DDX23/PRP28